MAYCAQNILFFPQEIFFLLISEKEQLLHFFFCIHFQWISDSFQKPCKCTHIYFFIRRLLHIFCFVTCEISVGTLNHECTTTDVFFLLRWSGRDRKACLFVCLGSFSSGRKKVETNPQVNERLSILHFFLFPLVLFFSSSCVFCGRKWTREKCQKDWTEKTKATKKKKKSHSCRDKERFRSQSSQVFFFFLHCCSSCIYFFMYIFHIKK